MSAAIERRELERRADEILRSANDNSPPAATKARFRGGRPALTWLAKHDVLGAACLWKVARMRLPEAANDNRADATGLAVDRRPSGKPRGMNSTPTNLRKHLALPGIKPRFGDPEHVAPKLMGWFAWFDLKPQSRPDFPFHPECRFGFCAPGIARGAIFMGAGSGLGQSRPGSNRGDVRRVEEPDAPTPPDEVDVVIEAVLARATVSGVGEALGAKGGYADRRGKKALRAAAEWAIEAAGAKLRHAAP